MRPYLPCYRAAFAFSVISYPLPHPPSLRSVYHVCGERRAYPVVHEEECVRHGWSLYPGGRLGCRHPQHAEVILPTYHFGDGLSASLAMLASRGFIMTLHYVQPYRPSLVRLRVEAGRGRNIVPRASYLR